MAQVADPAHSVWRRAVIKLERKRFGSAVAAMKPSSSGLLLRNFH